MEVKLKKNERSWAIQIIQKISLYVKNKSDFKIKLAGGETTINTGKQRMFPDVLLFADSSQSKILQGWELKMPDVPIDDYDFIHDAWRKANNLNLSSCVIWNFRYAVFYVKNISTGEFEKIKEWDNSSFISENRADVETYESKWESTLYEIIDEVNKYFVIGKYNPVLKTDLFVKKISEQFIIDNRNLLGEFYKNLATTDSKFSAYIDLWWDAASSEYIRDEKNLYVAYSKIILLDWMNKIFFAHLLRQYYPTPNKIIEIDENTTTTDALKIFDEITEKCDFYSVFHRLDYEEQLPVEIWNQIKEISSFLNNNIVDKIDQEELQSLLENAVQVSQRIIIGQYTTPPLLADFMVRISLNNARNICFDPCCGTGTFARALISYKAEKGLPVSEQYNSVFAEDRQGFPLQIAGLTTVSKESINIPSILFQGNIFEQNIGNEIKITNPNDGSTIVYNLPYFDTIISNLPFIDFCRNNIHNQEDEKHKEIIKKLVYEKTKTNLSKRSDYYMYIMIHLWNLLKAVGTSCVITSNSWLGTEAGGIFLVVLSQFFNIKGIVISGGKRWFDQVSVVTTILLLEKKEIKSPNFDEKINFYLMKSNLEDLGNTKIRNQAVGTVLLEKEIDDKVMQLNSYSWANLQFFKSLNLSLNICFHDVNWLLNIKDCVCKVNTIFDVIRGMKTGQDDIFFPKSKDVVDNEYIDSILQRSKECETLIASPDNFFVNCNKSYSELETLGHVKTAKYFRQFEGHLNQSVLQHGEIWYELKEAQKKPVIITGMNPNERLFFAKFEKASCINQRMVGFITKDESVDVELCHALLNSVLQLFFLESVGFGKGEGALDTSKDNVEKLFMLNPEKLNKKQKQEILKAFEPLTKRKIFTTKQEMQMQDRIDFDKTILNAFGLADLYEDIKRTLLELQERRLNVR